MKLKLGNDQITFGYFLTPLLDVFRVFYYYLTKKEILQRKMFFYLRKLPCWLL